MNNSLDKSIVRFSMDHPGLVTWIMALTTVAMLLAAGLPSLWPTAARYLHPAAIDTDPENMLSAGEPVRVFHNASKREFSLYDVVVVSVVNEVDPDGVFNVESLWRIHELTEFARRLSWPDPDDPERRIGVVETDMLAPSMVDNIEQAGAGAVSFDWLMPGPPETPEQALAVRDRAQKIPFFEGTLVSEDGKAIAIYLPLTDKDASYRVRKELLEEVASGGETDDKVHITGLPVAEDTFGVEMFYQMAISAPLAMLVIFLIMWWFFRNLRLVLSAMIIAMVGAMSTMALLVISGNTVHIMSSMIPVFIMPIAVLDAVHILSEFFDRYQHTRDRRQTMHEVMSHLFTPMLFTSLTTAAGFASLALTPIPPVQVFGIFVAIGVLLAWFWTITFIPAFVAFIPDEKLARFGHPTAARAEAGTTVMSRWLDRLGMMTSRHAKAVLAVTVAAVVIAGYGVSRININDNPVKWFEASHPIRIADSVLNEHFGGTYMAYLALEADAASGVSLPDYVEGFAERLEAREAELRDEALAGAGLVFETLRSAASGQETLAGSKAAFLDALSAAVEDRLRDAPGEHLFAWDEVQLFLDSERQRDEIFKQPEALRYIAALQRHLLGSGAVGKSSSLADIVKTVHRELLLGEPEQFRVPDSAAAVAQTLLTYQNSHRPQDLWHFVTPDYRKASIWVQLKSGDNKDMSAVVEAIADFSAETPPPFDLQTSWFGLTYINVVWQEKMVSGMLNALLGSFVVVLLMMVLLFRSLLWGVLCMVPLSVTIGLIYGVVGLIGKDYDMPIAVLSALSLGLSVDYAIHFLARSRAAYARDDTGQLAMRSMFGEPARAITRNAVVVGVGFLPLLAASLSTYKTVGLFIAAILLLAGLSTLLILPALITLFEAWLFPGPRGAGESKVSTTEEVSTN